MHTGKTEMINIVTEHTPILHQGRAESPVRRFRIPAIIAVVGILLLAGISSAQSNPDPFLAYVYLLPGEPFTPEGADGVTCQTVPGARVSERQYCSIEVDDAIISSIYTHARDGVVSQASFRVAPGSLVVQDLIDAWHEPHMIVRQAPRSSVFFWDDMGIKATGTSDSGVFDPSMPVGSVIFGSPLS